MLEAREGRFSSPSYLAARSSRRLFVKAKAKKTATKAKRKPAQVDPVTAKRAQAYSDMEPFVCNLSRMAKIADSMFDNPETDLYTFAVDHLSVMVERFRKRYYAVEFPRVED